MRFSPVALTSDELLSIMAKARARRLRDWVILVSLYWHGYRVSEVVSSSTRQLGLFYTREKADLRKQEYGPGAEVTEVIRRIRGKPKRCYLVQVDRPIARLGMTLGAIEGTEVTVQRLKRSLETTQLLQEHENPLLNERLAMDAWIAERPRLGKKGAARRKKSAAETQQNEILLQNPESPLFSISRSQLFRIFQRYAREAGLPRRKQHPHVLKHTIGSDLVDAGIPLPKVQVHLGHASLASTGKYTLPREDVVSREVGRAIRSKQEFRARQPDLFSSSEDPPRA